MGSSGKRRRVAIVHPWLPHYRVAFFDLLRRTLADHGIELVLAHGSEPHFAKGRGDERSLPWATRLREVKLSAAGRHVTLRAPWRPALDSDLLILEDGLRNLDTWAYVARRRFRPRPLIAFWGHGATMDRDPGAIERRLKQRLVGSADWWFAYTAGTAGRLGSLGLPAARITNVGNTIDVRSLIEASESVDATAVDRLRREHGLSEGHTALFIGGLSGRKNPGLLLEAAAIAASLDPAFRLLVVGDGPAAPMVADAARSNPAIRPIGPLFDAAAKATVAAAADFVVMPGLAGLAVVDCFAFGLPPVAVSPWNHAPEFEYLEDDVNCLITAPEPAAFAEAIGRMTVDIELRARLAAQCRRQADDFALEAMVARFSDGVMAALAPGPADRRTGSG